MVLVDRYANEVRDYMTTLPAYLAIGSSTTENLVTTTTTINSVITSVPLVSITYPTTKSFTLEYVLSSTESNGSTLKRIATREASTTSAVLTINDMPSLDKNNLVEVSWEVTLKVTNQ